MKKFVAIVLSVLTVLTATVMFAHADAEVSISSPSANSFHPGDTITISLNFSGFENVVGYNVTVVSSDGSIDDLKFYDKKDDTPSNGISEGKKEFSTFDDFSTRQDVTISKDAVAGNLEFKITEAIMYVCTEEKTDAVKEINGNLIYIYKYSTEEKPIPINVDTYTVEVLPTNTSTEESQPTSSEEQSQPTSSEASSEVSSEVSSDLLSSTLSDPFAVVSTESDGNSSAEDAFNTVTDVSSDDTTSRSIITSYNYGNSGGIGLGAIVLIILFAFIAGLGTMFIVSKVRNSKDEDETEADDEYIGGYQQGFVMPVVKQDDSADDGYKTVEDDSDIKINDSKKPKFNINIEYDDSWGEESKSESDVIEVKKEEPKPNDDFEPYYYDED